MAQFVYVLCMLTCTVCAILLLRGYRSNRMPLLFWASVCFVGLAINNAILFIDLVLLPQVDLFLVRSGVALAAMCVLLYGLIWDSR